MKVKIFYGEVPVIERQFNEWAKGKALTKDVIIHTVAFPTYQAGTPDMMVIAVYYPEGSPFDTEAEQE